MTGHKTTYEYPDADGRVRFKVVRNDNDDGTKTFAQFHITEVEVVITSNGRTRTFHPGEWVPRAPELPRALWNLPELEWLPDSSAVLVVEGDKTAIAAQALLGPSITVTTWAGGSSAVDKTDFGPLKRHRVVHWPDLDRVVFPEGHAQAGAVKPYTMQPGTKAMLKALTKTGGALANIPADFRQAASRVVTSGWDLADPIPVDYTIDDVKHWIHDAFTTSAESAARLAAAPEAVIVHEPLPDNSMHGEVLPPLNGTDVPPGLGLSTEGINFIRTRTGGIQRLVANVVGFLNGNNHFYNLRFNEFTSIAMKGEKELTDRDVRAMVPIIQHAGLHMGTDLIREGILTVAEAVSFHPVREYLNSLEWDGVERLDMILIDVGDAQDTPYVREVTRRWFISGVARIMQPGCQADHMLVLEGKQGLGKSRFFSSIAGSWFTDHLSDLASKDARQELRNGIWICELAELSSIKRAADMSHVKNFLTTRVDNYRDSYGRLSENHPRQCVFAGTVNPGHNGWMTDDTGGRRFWPVEISRKIDIDMVVQLRDQLWAEAKHLYDHGEHWYIKDESIESSAEREQAARLEVHDWLEPIREWLEKSGMQNPTTNDIMRQALKLDFPGQWQRGSLGWVGKCMKALGWKRVDTPGLKGRRHYVKKDPSS